jgi:hypothetical protein
VEVGGGKVGEVVERLRGGGEHSYYRSPAMGVSEPKKDVLMVGTGRRLPTALSLILSDTINSPRQMLDGKYRGLSSQSIRCIIESLGRPWYVISAGQTRSDFYSPS